ncbi:type II toxin-antitoxin system VapC family toxin [bacterium]|nr:type II toxin-antitoxin system VapC family toxin [bacterium]
MEKSRDFLLDTNIVLHYARESKVYSAIEQKFQLRNSQFSPMVCIVTLGEIRAMAYRRHWGMQKIRKLEEFLGHLVAIDISSPPVIDAYAKILCEAIEKGWGIQKKQNDLWIAAVAYVLNATLVTTDRDFDPLHGKFVIRVLLDANSGSIIG